MQILFFTQVDETKKGNPLVPTMAKSQEASTSSGWEDPNFCGGWMPDPAAVCVVTVYLILNLLLNYYSAFLLGGRDDLDGGGERGHLHLPIPIFYSMLNQVAIVIMTSIWCLIAPSVRFPVAELFKQNWGWLIFVSVIYAASIATNNASFESISLTVNTIFKSAMPFPTLVFSYFIEGKTYSLPILFIVAVLVAGTLLTVPYGGHVPETDTPEWIGYCLVIFSMVATALRPVVVSHLMRSATAQGNRRALTAVSMAWFDATIATCVLLPISIVTDMVIQPGVQTTFFQNDFAWRNWAYVGLGCVLAGVYGPVTFYAIKLTSSLGFVMIGNFKQVVLLAGAAIFVDNVTDPMLCVGVTVTVFASLTYSYWSNKEKTEKTAADKAKKDAETKLISGR